jgi:multiple sugar transport system ATP-binding protein
VRQPKVFLFDEPLSNLDAALRTKMRIEIARLRKQLNATAIYVTHDQVEAMTLADKIVVLRAGKIEQEGSPLEVYRNPVNRFVASFLGSPSMNFVPATLKTAGSQMAQLEFEGGRALELKTQTSFSSGTPVEFGIRPEHLVLGEDLPGRITGKVFAVEKLGDQALVHLNLDRTSPDQPETPIVARLPGDIDCQPDTELVLGFDPKRCHLFESEGSTVPAYFL